ncbi:MAG: YitT family protein [Clostridiales bacterium]|nr:YitT family protein [Clostridiales bacterium]
MAAGTGLMALAVNCVYTPLHIVTGGVSGIGIVVNSLTKKFAPGGIPVWITSGLINLPLLVWAYFTKGKTFTRKTIVSFSFFEFWLAAIPVIAVEKEDFFMAALIGGSMTGLGLGMVARLDISTGGSDLFSSLFQQIKPQYSLPQLLFWTDGLIILSGILTFGVHRALYAILAAYITTKVMNVALEGIRYTKMAYIISEKWKDIQDSILYQMDRGVTSLDGEGAYSHKKRTVLLCAVNHKEIVEVKELVYAIDPQAFMIITDAREVVGEGFYMTNCINQVGKTSQ